MVVRSEAFDLSAEMGWARSATSERTAPYRPPRWRPHALAPLDHPAFDQQASPVWVDEPVLRCIKRAHDIAQAHGAVQITVAHLLHAMTLISPAVPVLRTYGIDVAALRHDSAAAAATDTTLADDRSGVAPGPSAELDDLLQVAAERAFDQRALVTVSALLDTLLDMKRDMTHRNLLARHRLDWDLRTAAEPRERVRVSAGSHHLGPGGHPDSVPTPTDTMQNSRIDSLERAVRELSDDLALNRKTFATMVEELRESRAGGISGQGLYVGNAGTSYADPATEELELDHDHIIDRLHLIERSVDAKFNELARTWGVLGRRLDALEQGLIERAGDVVGLAPDVTERIAALPERLTALEAKLAATDGPGMAERLAAMERRILGSNSARFAPAELTEKLDRIDGAFTALIDRLDTLEEGLGQSGDGTWDFAPLSAGLKEIEARTGDTQLMIDTVDDRVKKVEDLLDAQRSQLAQVSSTVGTELKALTASVSAQGVGGERMSALIEDGMRGVAETFERRKNEIAEAVTREVADRFANLAGAMQQDQAEQARILTELADRLVATPGAGEDVVRMAESYQRDAGTMHEALRAINANQQRLAASMDQWHAEARDQGADLSERLKSLEGSGLSGDGGPLRQLSDQVDEIRGAIDRQNLGPWSRFRIWLYGTDDWYGASWSDRRDAEA
jgi:Clp amino terminal domain, pathogenicity island component